MDLMTAPLQKASNDGSRAPAGHSPRGRGDDPCPGRHAPLLAENRPRTRGIQGRPAGCLSPGGRPPLDRRAAASGGELSRPTRRRPTTSNRRPPEIHRPIQRGQTRKDCAVAHFTPTRSAPYCGVTEGDVLLGVACGDIPVDAVDAADFYDHRHRHLYAALRLLDERALLARRVEVRVNGRLVGNV